MKRCIFFSFLVMMVAVTIGIDWYNQFQEPYISQPLMAVEKNHQVNVGLQVPTEFDGELWSIVKIDRERRHMILFNMEKGYKKITLVGEPHQGWYVYRKEG